MNNETITQLIAGLGLGIDTAVIDDGRLKKTDGTEFEFTISVGWNLIAANECNNLWGAHLLDLFELIEQQNYTEAELESILSSIPTAHRHWDWVIKSCAYHTKEYVWFFLYADNKPQGACLIYQPKGSVLIDENIFYVEFIAVAPWNNDNKVRNRDFSGIGTIMLKSVLNYSVEVLGLTPGFSLHSLEQAEGYYRKLNMINVAAYDKPKLLYFELPLDEAKKVMEEL